MGCKLLLSSKKYPSFTSFSPAQHTVTTTKRNLSLFKKLTNKFISKDAVTHEDKHEINTNENINTTSELLHIIDEQFKKSLKVREQKIHRTKYAYDSIISDSILKMKSTLSDAENISFINNRRIKSLIACEKANTAFDLIKLETSNSLSLSSYSSTSSYTTQKEKREKFETFIEKFIYHGEISRMEHCLRIMKDSCIEHSPKIMACVIYAYLRVNDANSAYAYFKNHVKPLQSEFSTPFFSIVCRSLPLNRLAFTLCNKNEFEKAFDIRILITESRNTKRFFSIDFFLVSELYQRKEYARVVKLTTLLLRHPALQYDGSFSRTSLMETLCFGGRAFLKLNQYIEVHQLFDCVVKSKSFQLAPFNHHKAEILSIYAEASFLYGLGQKHSHFSSLQGLWNTYLNQLSEASSAITHETVLLFSWLTVSFLIDENWSGLMNLLSLYGSLSPKHGCVNALSKAISQLKVLILLPPTLKKDGSLKDHHLFSFTLHKLYLQAKDVNEADVNSMISQKYSPFESIFSKNIDLIPIKTLQFLMIKFVSAGDKENLLKTLKWASNRTKDSSIDLHDVLLTHLFDSLDDTNIPFIVDTLRNQAPNLPEIDWSLVIYRVWRSSCNMSGRDSTGELGFKEVMNILGIQEMMRDQSRRFKLLFPSDRLTRILELALERRQTDQMSCLIPFVQPTEARLIQHVQQLALQGKIKSSLNDLQLKVDSWFQ